MSIGITKYSLTCNKIMNIPFFLLIMLIFRNFAITLQNIDFLVSFGQEVPRSTHIFLMFYAIEVY